MTEQTENLKVQIARELYLAAEGLGARSDLLSIIGSYGDTLDDETILRLLENYNQHRKNAA